MRGTVFGTASGRSVRAGVTEAIKAFLLVRVSGEGLMTVYTGDALSKARFDHPASLREHPFIIAALSAAGWATIVLVGLMLREVLLALI
jgi:hypothetical protein